MKRSRLSRKMRPRPQRLVAWKQSLKAVMDNPDYIEENMHAIALELQKDNPSVEYLREKARHINEWIDEIEKFHTKIKFTPYGRNVHSVIREVKK